MQSLTRNITLCQNVDLDELAQKCEYFTGADFKALLYNAQLEAIHDTYGENLMSLNNQNGHFLDSEMSPKVSEGSVLSDGSWEKVVLPKRGVVKI